MNLVKYPVGKDIEDTICSSKVDLHQYDNLVSSTLDKTVLYYDDLSQAQKEAPSLIIPISINKKTIFYALIKSNKRECSIIQKLTLQPSATLQTDSVIVCSGNCAVFAVKNSTLTTRWYKAPSGGSLLYLGPVFSLGIK